MIISCQYLLCFVEKIEKPATTAISVANGDALEVKIQGEIVK